MTLLLILLWFEMHYKRKRLKKRLKVRLAASWGCDAHYTPENKTVGWTDNIATIGFLPLVGKNIKFVLMGMLQEEQSFYINQ